MEVYRVIRHKWHMGVYRSIGSMATGTYRGIQWRTGAYRAMGYTGP